MAHNDKPLALSDELLRALVDGELDAPTAAQVEAQLAQDAHAAEFVQRERALRQRLQAAFAPVIDEPMPDRLLAALGKAAPAANDASVRAPVLDLAAAREARPAARARRFGGWVPWMGMAASVALGLFIGLRLAPADGPMVASTGGGWVATAQLAQTLDTQSAATQRADAPVHLATSFVAQDGRYCRGFTLEHDAMAGLACRDGDRWRVEVLAKAEAQSSGGFRQAASALPPIVLQAMDARIAGTPLDAAAEQQALQKHWQH